jgi:hypothetical protein
VTRAVFAPRVSTTPTVAPDGSVVIALGSGFPPHAGVALTWQPGIERAAVTTDSAGAFRTSILVFPHASAGPRRLVASPVDGAPFDAVTAPFLVVPGTLRPNDFVQRG